MKKIPLVITVAIVTIMAAAPGIAQQTDDWKQVCRDAQHRIVTKGRGADTVKDRPTPNPRCVFLGRGNDRFIDPTEVIGGDHDIVFGGPRNDTIDLRDGSPHDIAHCGPGEDTLVRDELDGVFNGHSCENVDPPLVP